MIILAAMVASYAIQPPAAFTLVDHRPTQVLFMPSVEVAHRECKRRGVSVATGWTYGCAWERGLVILPDPCLFRDAAAKAVCAGQPVSVSVCNRPGFFGELCTHEIGHWAGWRH
jgi:hypothetical protein